MATILRSDGSREEVTIPDLEGDGLQFLQQAVGGYIEPVYLAGDQAMFVNDMGQIEGLPVNHRASELANQLIVGDVVVGTRRELGFDDGDEGQEEAIDGEVEVDA